MVRPRTLLPLAASVLLCACAGQGPFPSLAPRAVERELSGQAAPPCVGSAAPAAAHAPAAPLPSDVQLASRVTALVADARSGQSAFEAVLPRANASAARAGAAGSDSWIAAQQDISRLEAARVRTQDALAELESLSIARSGDQATNEADRASVLAAAEEVRVLAAGQQAEIERLSAPLSEPSALRRAPLQAPHNAQRQSAARQALVASGRAHISPGALPKAGPTGSSCRG